MSFFKNNHEDKKNSPKIAKISVDSKEKTIKITPSTETSNDTAKSSVANINSDKQPSVSGSQKDDIYFLEPYSPAKKPSAVNPEYKDEKDVLKSPYSDYVVIPTSKKTNAIIFVVENSIETQEYKQDILKLVNKITSDNSSSLFMFLQLGNKNSYSNLLTHDELKEAQLPESMFYLENISFSEIDLISALTHINHFMAENTSSFRVIKIGNDRYVITDVKIIFIGSGNHFSDHENASYILQILRYNPKVATIKYFCIKDYNAINISAIGFPVIGHIESNFYK